MNSNFINIATPNYGNPVKVGGNFTAPDDGIYSISVVAGSRYIQGSINGEDIIQTATQGSANVTMMTNTYILRKGNIVAFSRFESPSKSIFYPFKKVL